MEKSNMPSREKNFHVVITTVRRTHSKEECLRTAYEMLTHKYHGGRLKTLTRCWELLPRSIDRLWAKSGFLHCTNLNRLLRYVLIESGHFQKRDIKARWTLLWYVSPHQFLHVHVGEGRWIAIDCRAKHYGVPYGEYAHGFSLLPPKPS